MALHFDRNQEATVWIGGLDENVDEKLLWELMIQAGPVISVNIPRDKITHEHQGYAFCEFASEEDADYAMKIMNMVRLYGKSLKINKASRDRKDTGVGANVFVGNLDPEVDDQLLYNTFSAFGQVLSAKVMYEDDGSSRGFAFVNFADFESSDAAILHMNGQFLCNRPVHVSYAYKKDTKGEKHGSETERLFAAKMQAKSITRPHMHFASTAPQLTALAALSTHPSQQQHHHHHQQQPQQQFHQPQQQQSQHKIVNNQLSSGQIIPNSSLIGHQLPLNNASLIGHNLPGHPHLGIAPHLNAQYTPATAQAIQNAALIQQAAMMQQQQIAAIQQARMLQQRAAVNQQQAQAQGQSQQQNNDKNDNNQDNKDNHNNNNAAQQKAPPPPPPNLFMRGPPPPHPLMAPQPPGVGVRPPFPPPPGMGFPPMPPPGVHGMPFTRTPFGPPQPPMNMNAVPPQMMQQPATNTNKDLKDQNNNNSTTNDNKQK